MEQSYQNKPLEDNKFSSIQTNFSYKQKPLDNGALSKSSTAK